MSFRSIAAWLLLAMVLIATVIVTFSGKDLAQQDRNALLEGASRQHPAGTDALGRDRFVRVAAAFLLSLAGAVAASALSTAAAAGVGVLAAFSTTRIAALAMLVCDVFLALPWLFLLMMVRSMLALTTSPAHSALITFVVLAARAGGMRLRQIPQQVLPNLVPLLLPQFLICVPAFIVAEANLGTLGLGVGEPLPSWGSMLLELGNSSILMQTNWVYLPIAVLVMALLLLESTVAREA
jgi:peptide/nickel transport system permease protein